MMKKLWGILSVLGVLLVSYAAYSAEENPFLVKYPFQSVKITYTSNMGNISSSEETLIIKEQSTVRTTITTNNIGGSNQTDKQLVVTTPDYIYTLDMVAKMGVKTTNPAKIMLQEYNKLTPEEQKQFLVNLEKFGKVLFLGLDSNAKSSLGKENILGKECEILEFMGTKIWVWTEVKEILKMSGMQEKIATKIEENISLADSEFEIPSGVTVNPDPTEPEMQKMTLLFFQAIKEGKPLAEAMPMEGDLGEKDIPPSERFSSPPPPPHYVEEESIKEENTAAPEEGSSPVKKKEMTPEEEEQLRQQFKEQGMDPALIDRMIEMMKHGAH